MTQISIYMPLLIQCSLLIISSHLFKSSTYTIKVSLQKAIPNFFQIEINSSSFKFSIHPLYNHQKENQIIITTKKKQKMCLAPLLNCKFTENKDSIIFIFESCIVSSAHTEDTKKALKFLAVLLLGQHRTEFRWKHSLHIIFAVNNEA